MSVIHLQQIEAHIRNLFDGKIDLSDLKSQSPENIDSFFLTRSLAAYSILYLSQADLIVAADSVTDGSQDNGIDAIHYDRSDKRLYLSQSKWISNGKGEPGVGDIMKFCSGITDLLNHRFDRFNEKTRKKEQVIKEALEDPYTKLTIVLVYTSINDLAKPGREELQKLQAELNDVSEVVDVEVITQQNLHKSLTIATSGEPISLDIDLKEWGCVHEPHLAYYGQVGSEDIAEWWTLYHTRLFSKNIRSILGNTDVNSEMRSTLSLEPDLFWYFNNGITIVAKDIKTPLKGGSRRDHKTFHCKDISIVNGAQTVSTIGRYSENLINDDAHAFVPVRLISLQESDPEFERLVTRNNNRQNKIENRDFVSLDPEQTRLRQELAIDGVNYHFVRSEHFESNEKSFDIVEATTALACASGKVDLVVQLKREIGKLWEDIERAPYRILFNRGTSSRYLWKCVKVQRKIDRSIQSLSSNDHSILGKREAVLTNGNRLISTLVFKRIAESALQDDAKDIEEFNRTFDFDGHVKEVFERMCTVIDLHYEGSVVITLFKNKKKCEDLLHKSLLDNEDDPKHPQLTFDFGPDDN